MSRLTGQSPWEWGEEQQNSFETLKKALTTAPVLHLPIDDGQFKLETDALDGTLGAVLSQKQENKWVLIVFLSKAMNDTERNYKIYDKELYTIMAALEEWRHLLMGAAKELEIWSDHQNLTYW